MSKLRCAALVAGLSIVVGACGDGSSSSSSEVDAALASTSQEVTGQEGTVTIAASSTVLNQYGVLAADVAAGAQTITVTNINDFTSNDVFDGGLTTGDLIMLYQPMGASITVVNSETYGTLGALQGAGNYELVHVVSVAGNTITIENTCGGLENAYTTDGRTQVIRVPQAASLVFVGAGASLAARPWDGTRGGVVAMHVQGNAAITQGGITATGRGFRGGALELGSATGSDVFVSNLAAAGAQKGESIAGDQATYASTFGGDNGRGAPANGGGGGNSDGGPGGGGANGDSGNAYNGHGVMNPLVAGAAAWSRDPAFLLAQPDALTTSAGGGRGGYSRSNVDLDPEAVGPDDPLWGADERRTVGGRGGHPLANDPAARLFLGGGGGAGASPLGLLGGPGGAGGGLVLLIADTVTGGGTIQANGIAGAGSTADAPGGGGAGGTIVVKANSITGVQLHADGGAGGIQSALLSTTGGGGGGGGGFIATSTTTVVRTANGGAAGTTTSGDVNEFPVNGATDGAVGQATVVAGVLPVCTPVDLSITKTNGVASSTPGTATVYTIVAKNNGKDVVAGATVADTFVAALGTPTWTCTPTAGSVCPLTGSGNINTPVTLAPDGTVTFTVNATIAANATGNLSNTATITAPAGITEIDTGNNSATDTDTLTPSANLAVTISDSPDPVNAGAGINYSIGVSNAGPSTAVGVEVTNVLPPGTSFSGFAGTGWSCAEAAGTVTCTRAAALGVAAAPNLTITLQAPDEAGTVSNTVSVTSDTTDPVAGNNTANTTTTVNARSDLAVTVTDSPDPVIAGGTLTYTVNVNNLGPSTAQAVTMTDTLAATTTFVSANGTGWSCDEANHVVTCTRASLAPGAAPSIAIVVTAPAQSGSISNTATIATTTTDPIAGNNSQTISTSVTASADLAIAMTDAPDPVTAGATLTYSITVSNSGPSNAATVAVSDPLPAGTTLISAAGTGWACSGTATVSCSRAGVNAGATAPVIAIQVTAPAQGGPISNTATVTAATGDPNTNNNSATVTTNVEASANLAIAVADSPDPVNAAATLTYTVTATNAGPSTAGTVTVVDTLPPGTTFIDVTATGWSCNEAAGVVTCTRATLATGVVQPITIRVTAPTAGGVITNNATVASATTPDPDTTNNSVNTNTTVNARADLSITKTDDPDPVATGATLTYTIAVANAGPSDAANLTMTDTLPANVGFVSATGTGWTCNQAGATVTCTRPSLGVGAAPNISIVVTAPLAFGTISNTAVIASTTTDPVPGNNTDTEQTTVAPTTDLAIDATAIPEPIEAGNQLTYTVTVTNNGPITATGVDVTTTLPASLAFASGTGTGWTCGAVGQAVTCTLASLAIGVAPELTIVVDTDAVSGTTATTVLAVSSNFADQALGNNSVSLDTLILDREIEIESATFPETFRNPGADAPIRAITVTNTGGATLNISSVTLDTADPMVWAIIDDTPQAIPPGASFDYRVRFTPTAIGPAPDATVTIASDDRDEPSTVVTFTGVAVDRNVRFGLPRVDLGYTGIGVPVTVDDALVVASMNSTTTFAITTITFSDDPACEDGESVTNAGAFAMVAPPVGDELLPGAQRGYAVRFTATTPGRFVGRADLFIDPDSVAQASVCVEGQAVFVDAHGGGGCNTGGGSAGAGTLLLGLGALGMMLRRRRRALIAGAIALTAVPASADKLAISIFDPTPATTGTNFQLQSADVGHTGDYVLTATFSHATNPLILDGGMDGSAQVIQSSTLMMLGGAFAFLERFEAGARVPLYFQAGAAAGDRFTMFTAEPAEGTAMGDITLHGKARLWRRGGAALGAGLQLTIPTAEQDSFTGTEKPSLRALGLASLVPDTLERRISLTGHFGAVARAKSEFANIEQGSGVTWGLGVSVRALDRMWLSAEVFGDVLPAARKATATSSAVSLSPIEWLGGLRYAPDHRFSVGLAFGRGLTAAAGSPSLRGVLELVYAPRAPELRPIRIPVQPKPDLDADADGIRDSVDKCKNDPEDIDLFDDTDGCPDLDNDADGVADAADKCPLDPEDKDGFDDTDGCPDKDNDNDSIADAMDKCPNEPEDKDGFNDLDGCPDPDNDGDGIVDAKDKCPTEQETINGNKDDDGCPDPGDSMIVLSPDRIETLDAIQFDRGAKVSIAKASFNVLGQIGATMRAHPEIIRMRVTVHVHPSGNYDKDQDVSDKRAQAIRDWLVQYGIAATRVEARGFGSSKPLAQDGQRGAADINNRVELIILERK